jgi:SSS family solute:Na+ symporter
MDVNTVDILVIIAYFVVLLAVGFWKGRGQRDSSDKYFISKGLLPWWAIAAAFIATGMNTEQLIGANGMAYKVGLTMANWSTIVVLIYTPLIFVFYPIYRRNGVVTMPEYLGRRFDRRSENVFAVLLLVSYILLNLAVVFYGGAKLLEVVFGLNMWYGLLMLALVAGVYTMYGGMSSMIYTAVFQFLLIFASGFVLFFLALSKLPNGWQDVVDHAPGGFHLIQPMDFDSIPWHAIPLTIFGLHLFYSCINQAVVQRGMGARTEWDVRMALLVAGFFAVLRVFIEVFPGMMARALAFSGYPEFKVGDDPSELDRVFPILIRNLIPAGLQGLIVVGILASVMSTIAAYLNSISTLLTFDVYKKWINKEATDKQLIRVGTLATLALMIFGVIYAPVIGKLGGIFPYFQEGATYIAVPIATVFLFGMFWWRATSTAALAVILAGIPICLLINKLVLPVAFSQAVTDHYSLDNFLVQSGINQVVCSLLMVVVSLFTQPRALAEIAPLLWTKKCLFLPDDEPRRPLLQSAGFWWVLFVLFYVALYIVFW